MKDEQIDEILDIITNQKDGGNQTQKTEDIHHKPRLDAFGQVVPVLFIDVDFVLNTNNTADLVPGTGMVRNEEIIFSIPKLKLLKEIYVATNCDVVIASPYRKKSKNLKFFTEVFNSFGIKIAGYTPVLEVQPKDEIVDWFAKMRKGVIFNRYCIVSNSSSFCLDPKHFIKTTGLGIVELLKKDIIQTLKR